MNDRVEEMTMPPRVRWSGLYALAGLMLAALLGAQALPATGAERSVLQCALVLVGFGAMGQWTRRNRVSLDHIDWCACASSRVTVRVIPSGRGVPTATRDADARPWDDLEPAELEEIAR